MILYDKHVNQQTYSSLQKALDFVKFLGSEGQKEKYYNDIHFFQEEDSWVVEWVQIYYDRRDECGSFKFVNSDEYVMKEILFPDNHIEYVSSLQEEEDRWKEWEKENPEWVQTAYGTWFNKEEDIPLK